MTRCSKAQKEALRKARFVHSQKNAVMASEIMEDVGSSRDMRRTRSSKLQDVHTQLREARSAARALQERVEELEINSEDLAILRNELADLRKTAARTQAELVRSEARRTEAEHKAAKSLQTLRTHSRRFSRAQATTKALRKQTVRLRKSLKASSTRCARLESLTQESKATLSALRVDHASNIRDLQAAHLDLDTALCECSQAQHREQSALLELGQTREQLAHAQQLALQFRSEATYLDYKASAASAGCDLAFGHLQTLDIRLAEARETEAAIQLEAATATALLETTREETDLLNSKYEAACQRLQKTSNENSTLRAYAETARRKSNALSMRLRRLRKTPTFSQDVATELGDVVRQQSKKSGPFKTRMKIRNTRTYCARTRALARVFVRYGCPQEHVGKLICLVGKEYGVDVESELSRRTVKRCLLEGSIATTIQLGFDLHNAESFTISGDGTSHRHRNYESQCIALNVPTSYTDPSAPCERTVRALGVHMSANHTSETQCTGWQDKIAGIIDLLNRSPLARQKQLNLSLVGVLRKLCGMNSDHAEDQKKLARLIKEWKQTVVLGSLGSEVLLARSPEDQAQILSDEHKKTVLALGGENKWDSLSAEAKDNVQISMMRDLTSRLGSEALSKLSEEEQQDLTLFLWAGCCMHKELNTTKGANAGMLAWWSSHPEVPGPILLANKDNAATLAALSSPSDASTPAEVRAFDISTAGAVKLSNLAGALFNHRDDKKGLQDVHRDWFKGATFPDTSNTRYQSHVLACTELLKHFDGPYGYIKFLEHVRDKKENRRFNHLELNVYQALQDTSTRTEMAAFTLYGQTVGHPYARKVRGPGTGNLNVLDLVTLHRKMKLHVQKLRANPQLVLAPDADPRDATFDGEAWTDPEAIAAVRRHAASLPHLEALFLACLEGAEPVWERFSAEFAEGGAIDTASAAVRLRAWMPSTNDANEGALGALRLWLRQYPTSGLPILNAVQMIRRNNTEDFIEAHLDDQENQQFIRREARALDARKEDQARRKAILEAEIRAVEVKRKRTAKKKAQEAAKEAELAQLDLVLDEKIINKMFKPQLAAQLEKLRREDSKISKKSHIPNRQGMVDELLAAVARFKLRHADSVGTAEGLMNVDLADPDDSPTTGLLDGNSDSDDDEG